MGDFNARHRELGSHHTNNANGVRWKAFLDATEVAVLTGNNLPTHVQGGRLDYVVTLNMPTYTVVTSLVRNLLSDHFALETTIPIGSTAPANRKRLDVPTARLGQLTAYVEAWYSATRDTYTDADSLYGSLTDIIEDFVEGTRGPTQSNKPCQRTYARDPRIVNCQQTLATYQRQWQKNPGDHEAREAMVVVARHLTELRQEVRKIYWNDFLAKVRQTKSLQEVWQHVNQVRGKKRRPTCTPDPAAKAQELMYDWKGASSLSGLPRHHQEELANQRQRRRDLVHQNVILEDDTCVAITHDELLYAVKRGKSTAPGKDGLTYNVLNAIIAIKGNNPIVDLLNMSYNSVQFSMTQLRPLELIQNEAMRIILGCPRTAKIEVLRAELDMPSIVFRIQEIACRATSLLLCSGAPSFKQNLTYLHHNPRYPVTPFVKKIVSLLRSVGIMEECLGVITSPRQPTWRPHRVSVDIEKLTQRKSEWIPQVLRNHFLLKLSQYSHRQVIHIYCDGSVDGSKSGCGVFIRDYTTPDQYTDTEVTRRLPHHLSSTRAELYAILQALHTVIALNKDVYIFVDSQAALYELLSTSPCDCDLVNKCFVAIDGLEQSGARVQFVWIPSHVGIKFNERADFLARQALQDDTVDPGAEYTLGYIRNKIKTYVSNTITDQLEHCCIIGSTSSRHYVDIIHNSHHTYGRHSDLYDVTAMRLRLGYKYYWEVSGSPAVSCTLCHQPRGHSLKH
ncbi:hypothetical protein Pmani_007332 [Petrolisthes manimaculis]|uniref:ribonuclease H n=1 Tax=Petrolisthes manimaculis TaxID=1843537 RepID=A0AAE1Q8Q2_9EUCA|nr:hypothetical protein Pmani_007332 [Petrolisthes manimaculis]